MPGQGAEAAFSPLFRMAVSAGSVAAVLRHLKAGASPNGADDAGRTPIMIAASKGHLDVCRVLIEYGADRFRLDKQGRSARDMAHASLSKQIGELFDREAPTTIDTAPEMPVQEADAGGWEAEEKTAPPTVADAISTPEDLQTPLGLHRPTTSDADWSDVEATLPAEKAPALPKNYDERAVRRFMGRAILSGRVSQEQIEAVAASDPRGLLGPHLSTVLEDLGAEIEDYPPGMSPPIERTVSGRDFLERERLDEALAFLSDLERSCEPHQQYTRDMNSEPVRDEAAMASLWHAAGAAKRQVALALVPFPSLANALMAMERETGGRPASVPSEDEDDETPDRQDDVVPDAVDSVSDEQDHDVETLSAEQTVYRLCELRLSTENLETLISAIEPADGSLEVLKRLNTAVDKLTKARGRLVAANLRLVPFFARRYANRGLDYSDVIQEGNLGLMKAVERFDPNREIKFSTYAQWWIRQQILRSIQDLGRTIRLPVHIADLAARVARLRGYATIDVPRSELKQLAQRLEVSEDAVRKAALIAATLLDQAEGRCGEEAAADIAADGKISPFAALASKELVPIFTRLFEDLEPRIERIMRMRFGIALPDEFTLEEIGNMFGLTRERVRQLESKGIKRLRNPVTKRALAPNLDVRDD